ncbi:peptide-methionine (S)-S-oxide reductase MsrA [Frigidibacter sp. RF13]|uniref:peptide-methionine (S)-S-oxide reductase MsrA n=1 Tax=Frigidibacter sp. RF13 TaxID=2997340 RepID=UPI002270739B|nr:peptide-methionine (S)-S-oxide reductase MsrA [Frigidibacter sp. RF13]MCY1126451.1 peptide-methionine (S)-S-oxide reductase MsrA [Frigidibacter sp. RF13]
MRAFLVFISVFFAPLAARADTAILAGGCFWCLESNFESVPGVSAVISGYTGGHLKNPTYDDVTSETSGHLESVKITFDPGKVSYSEIVRLFLHSTDVLDAGGQFCDRGESYTSAIFARNAAQRAAAEAEVAKAEKELGRKIVTPVRDAVKFWPAEDYHQDYYKGSSIVLTRRGPKTKAAAYAFYRNACGRDQRVKQLWGSQASFVH